MTYTMTSGRNTIKIDTVSGNISGDTYGMRQMIKDNFTDATWNAEAKVWHSDAAAEEIEKHIEYYKRVYKLSEVKSASTASEHHNHAHSELCPICHTYCYGDCQCH